MYDKPDNFGKDLGLMHELIVLARKMNMGREWWKQLLDKEILIAVAEFLSVQQTVLVPILNEGSFQGLLSQFPGRHSSAIRPQDVDLAWWRLREGSSGEEEIPMSLFRCFNIQSEHEVKFALSRHGLRPANTLELFSFSSALFHSLSSYQQFQKGVCIEHGVNSHIVALNARRIDGKEQDVCLGVNIHNPQAEWALRSYRPSNNTYFWDYSNSNILYFLAVPLTRFSY